ncbi:MAG: molybdopterin-binding protein [Epsilonproteobacteria bacterium]|nr:molybdopterin-binding protein [Campylobacterota bacterium]NPA65036.1 competence/damage-inducible protein A [Campylobacterota bacterium]
MKKPEPNFYQVIVGTEILNARRDDRHFPFLRDELLKRGYWLKGSFIVEDDPDLMKKTFELVRSDPDAVLFSFGGIGATPDDHTRQIAAEVFGDGQLHLHGEAKRLILERFGDEAYPHRINMAMLPKGARLLHNPINKVPGFYLDNRYFFVPGFPQMAHPMIKEALDRFWPKAVKEYRYTICVEASENDLMDIMQALPKDLDFSSLPAIKEGRYYDVISIASKDPQKAKYWIDFFIHEIEKRGFRYHEGERCS